MRSIAADIGATQGQLALAWVLKIENVSSAITGASRVEQVNENVESLAFIKKLTPEILQRIDEALGNKPPTQPLRHG